MRAAPPLALALGSGRLERAAVALLCGASAACAAFWAMWHGLHAQVLAVWPAFALLPLVAAAAAVLGWRACRPAQGRLAWNGRSWELQDPHAAAAVELSPALDLGGWLLLRLTPATGPVRWAGLSRRALGASDWHALRATLYSARPQPAGPPPDEALRP